VVRRPGIEIQDGNFRTGEEEEKKRREELSEPRYAITGEEKRRGAL